MLGWLGFLPEVLSGHSPDIRNAIAGLYEHYGLAFSSCLNVRAIFSFYSDVLGS